MDITDVRPARALLRTFAVAGAGREDVGAAVEQGPASLFGGV
ncbi:hypothetical protein ACFYO2_04720 [Streptomyces sp. NPDC006602]